MSNTQKGSLAVHTLDFNDNGRTIQIKVQVCSNDVVSALPHIVFFTGFGEQRPQALAGALRPFTSLGFKTTAIGVPFDKVSLRAADWLLDEGLNALIRNLGIKNEKIILSGISRGAAVAASVFGNDPARYDGLLLVSPLGLVRLSSGKYIFRTMVDSMNMRYYGKETFRNTRDITKEVINHAMSKDGLGQALKFAMNQQDRVANGVRLAKKNHKVLAIFCGSEDKVFRMHETSLVLTSLLGDGSIEHTFHSVKGNHAPVASKIGQYQLHAAASWLKAKYFSSQETPALQFHKNTKASS